MTNSVHNTGHNNTSQAQTGMKSRQYYTKGIAVAANHVCEYTRPVYFNRKAYEPGYEKSNEGKNYTSRAKVTPKVPTTPPSVFRP